MKWRSKQRGAFLHLILLTLLPPPTHSLSLPSSFLLRRAPPPITRSLSAGDFVCRTTGECSPCPASERSTPSCQLYGNRRPLTCVASPSLIASSASSLEQYKHAALLRTGTNSLAPARPPVAGSVNKDKPVIREGKDPDAMGLDDDAFRDAVLKAAHVNGGGDGDYAQGSSEEDEALDELEDEDDGGRRRTRRSNVKRTSSRRRTWDPDLTLVQRDGENMRELKTWEACERVVKKERADFMEFVLCNLAFALIAVSVLVMRHRNLAMRQYGRLAARINFSHAGATGSVMGRADSLGIGSVSL